MPFEFREEHLALMFSLANLEVPRGETVFFGLRGCSPVDDSGTRFAPAHQLEFLRADYLHMNCTLGQWTPGAGIAVFPGSTVPHITAVRGGIARGGAGVNQLALGFYRDGHRYYKGDHKIGVASRRHRAFRNDSSLPVWRTGDDEDYDGEDHLKNDVPFDNLHCAWQLNVAAPSFSSVGCQVVAGMPRVEARGWLLEKGPWARFIAHAYELEQRRFCYALFAGHEALKTATTSAVERSQTVRFGSKGPAVERVQAALIAAGYDIGSDTPDGDCGFGTIDAVRRFQVDKLGAQSADLIVGPATARALGLMWPDGQPNALALASFVAAGVVSDGLDAGAASAAGGRDAAAADIAQGTYNEKYKVTFRSLVAGGFYSADPDDLDVKRAIRTNNPGALNIRDWQRGLPGFVGVTMPDKANNVTSIYDAPEHGVAAWYHLIAFRYGYGVDGAVRIGDLARRYAGVKSEADPRAQTYVAGWRRGSGGALVASSVVNVAQMQDMLLLARAMFFHEIGSASPLKDNQIIFGIDLGRGGGGVG